MNGLNGLRRYGPAGVAVFAAIIAVIVWVVNPFGPPCTISVDGQAVASVSSRPAAVRVLSTARKSALGACSKLDTRFDKPVTLSSAPGGTGITPLPEAVRAVEESVGVEVQAYAVVADNAAVVALPSKEAAERALEMLKKHYRDKVKAGGEATFKGDVHIDRRYVPSDVLRETADDALSAMTSISRPAVYHVVLSGDRAVKLSEQYAVSMQDMKKLNPGVDLERLAEGAQLLIRRAQLPVTVVNRVETTKTTTVNAPAESVRAGIRTGRRTARLVITYENGEPVSEEIVSQLTTWERPKTPQVRSDEYGSGSSRRYRHSRRYRTDR